MALGVSQPPYGTIDMSITANDTVVNSVVIVPDGQVFPQAHQCNKYQQMKNHENPNHEG